MKKYIHIVEPSRERIGQFLHTIRRSNYEVYDYSNDTKLTFTKVKRMIIALRDALDV